MPSEIFTKSQEIVFNQLNQASIKSFIAEKTGLSIDLSLQATGLARARRNLATNHIASLRSGLTKLDPIKELLLLPDFSYQSTDLLVSKLSSELEAELS